MVKTGIIWSFIVAIFCLLFVHIPSIAWPFLISFILAYALSPLMEFLQEKFRLPRTLSACIVLSIFLVIFGLLLVLLLPLIYSQISILVSKIPIYKSYVNKEVVPYILEKLHSIDSRISISAKSALNQSVDNIFEMCVAMLNNIWSYTMATINAIVMIFLIPILLFYFLKDWEKMKFSFYDLFPTTTQKLVRNIFFDINNILSAYIRGQLLVCLIWAVYYYMALAYIGIDLALILAVISGIAPIVPVVGAIISISASMIVGYFTFGFDAYLLYILLIYVVGNIIDSALVTPKIIGDSIGINPIWIVFSVLVLGYLIGPIGMLVAIPIAGVISVILKYARQDYKDSELYKKKK
jgi:putative permease